MTNPNIPAPTIKTVPGDELLLLHHNQRFLSNDPATVVDVGYVSGLDSFNKIKETSTRNSNGWEQKVLSRLW